MHMKREFSLTFTNTYKIAPVVSTKKQTSDAMTKCKNGNLEG